MKRLSPCLACRKKVRLFKVEIAGEFLELPCDPMPTLQGTIKLIDLVNDIVEVTEEPAAFQYQVHDCREAQ